MAAALDSKLDITDNNKKAINMQSMCVVAVDAAAAAAVYFFFPSDYLIQKLICPPI